MLRSAFSRKCRYLVVLLSAGIACDRLEAQAPSPAPVHTFFRVEAPSAERPVSGRLLIFLKAGSGDSEVTTDEMAPMDVWVCAREVHNLAPGSLVEVDADEVAFPRPFSELPSGLYEAQAVLDVNHAFNYSGRVPRDWVSPVVTLAGWRPGTGAEPLLKLERRVVEDPQHAAAFAKLKDAATSDVAQYEEFESPALSRFWGRSMKIKAWVILPPGYGTRASQKYPTAYWTHGFGGEIDRGLVFGLRIYERMKNGTMPPMIWVMLDESIPQGTHEFADSVNNGPWGTALTAEFIPWLEKKFRMDARAYGRLLTGHSSGGWATLQLQINYPKVFGGTWSTSPDPSDFHDFNNVDLYGVEPNMYRAPDGSPVPLVRDKGKVMATNEQFTRLEDVTGLYGGQVSSFDWVFSPKGASGAPEQLFDHTTGKVNPEVAAYWREHYDLAHIVETTWPERGAYLKGRIHLFVGTADTYYLDGPAHKLEAVLRRLGGEPHFTYLPDRTHGNVYQEGSDNWALFDTIGTQMWESARGMKWTPPAKEPQTQTPPKGK
jgi:Putative esterase